MWHPLNDVKKKACIWICRHDDRHLATKRLLKHFEPWKLKAYMHHRISRLTLGKTQKYELIDFMDGTIFPLKWHYPTRKPPWNEPLDYFRQPPSFDELMQKVDDWKKRGGKDVNRSYFDFGNL